MEILGEFNPFSPIMNIHILLTFLHTSLMILVGRILLNIRILVFDLYVKSSSVTLRLPCTLKMVNL